MSKSFWEPRKSCDEQDRAGRKSAESQASSEQLARLNASYAEQKKVEAELAAVVGAVKSTTDIKQHAGAKGELAAVGDILATFPAEVRAAYRPPQASAGAGAWEA